MSLGLGSIGAVLFAGGLAWMIVGWPAAVGAAMVVAGVVLVGLTARK